jgi:hypothetical protein
MRAPFSSDYPLQYPTLYPLPNTSWPGETTWTNHITMVIQSNSIPLARYSIAIDNQYWLYVNGAYLGTGINNNYGSNEASWPGFNTFLTNGVSALHSGTNNIVVGIQDTGAPDYFSMVVTTNTCGH